VTRTKTDEILARTIADHSDDPERVEILGHARAFKASWLELGEALGRVRSASAWQRWGYESFDEYVKRELHIKPDTAAKLCGSYGFLAKHAPEVLERDGVAAPIPAYQAVEFLAHAYERECPKETRAEIRQAVLDEGATPGALARRYGEILAAPAARADRARSQLLAAVRRLAQLLTEVPSLPKRLAADVEEQLGRLVEELEREPAPKGTRSARKAAF